MIGLKRNFSETVLHLINIKLQILDFCLLIYGILFTVNFSSWRSAAAFVQR